MANGRVVAGYVLMIGALSGMILGLEWLRVSPSSPLELVYLGLLGLTIVPVSILLVSTATYLARGPAEFKRLPMARVPPVAVLYAVYNDMLPEAIAETLRNLESTSADVWLLSDSTARKALEEERALPGIVRIFRRASRWGGKAGILNEWLRAHGAEYRYIFPMDADAILNRGTLPSLLEIAEHPENLGYAGFQTLMEVHPAVAPTAFARLLGRGVKWGSRIVPLANQRVFGQAMYWGSNALFRTNVIREVDGFVEDNICDDFALTARLDAAGHRMALVDLYNFEGFPPDALSLRERTVRWCKATLSVAPSVFRTSTSFAVRLNVAIPLLFYAMAPALLSLLLISILAPSNAPLHRLSSALGAALLLFVILHRIVLVPRNRPSISSFLATLAAETLVVLGMALRISWAFVDFFLRRPTWEPSRKRAQGSSALNAIRASIPELAAGAILLALIGFYGSPPTSVALASVWIVSFLSSPVILWWSSWTGAGSKTSGRTPREAKERTTSSWTNRRIALRIQMPKAKPLTKPMKTPIQR